jgi:hypothetical protein
VAGDETQFCPGLSLLPQTSAEGTPLWDLQVDGKLARKFETRGLVNLQVILREGEGILFCQHRFDADCRRSGGFISTCLMQ